MRVELRDEARDDLVEVADFYVQQLDGLDEHFLGLPTRRHSERHPATQEPPS
jgi:hypothetical protein